MFDDKKGKSVPGPGNYPIKSQAFEANKGFAMGIKLKEQSKLIVPGAGTYEPTSESVKPKAAGYSMGCKLKSDLVNTAHVPGPGAYTGSDEKLKHAAPKFGFGSSTRTEIGKTKFQTPGPGSYR